METIPANGAAKGLRYMLAVSDFDCTGCGSCAACCPAGALKVEPAVLTEEKKQRWNAALAVSDKGESFAFPKTVINEYNTEKLIQKIANCAKEYLAEEIVVGLPKNMDGSLGWRAEECTEIAQKIKESTNLPITMWDERCTTVTAHNILSMNDKKGKKRKETVDAVAAVIILENYLSARKNGV